MKKQLQPIDTEVLLHDNGFKKTSLRMALLEILANATAPLSVAQLVRKTKKIGADVATLYRALH
jgi:Fe2+ or Zn2+ uptake regulation protein